MLFVEAKRDTRKCVIICRNIPLVHARENGSHSSYSRELEMILFCVSLPGRFGDWCDAVIGRLAETVLGHVVATGANTAEELASELVKTDGQHFYVGSRHPSRWLREKLAENNRKVVVALDDPRYAVRDLIVRHNLELPEATRRVASSCASMTRFIGLSDAHVVSAERDWRNPAVTIAAMADHFGLVVASKDIEAIAAELAAAGLEPNSDPGESWSAQLPEPSLAVINGALAPYAEFFLGGSLGQITWGRELFLEEHHQAASHPIDLSGPIRYLIYGPYIALPPGNWAAELLLGFSEDTVNTGFRVEVWAGSQLNTASINPPHAGVFPVNVGFVVEEANDNLAEIRVLNERAAIYGRLVLGHATLTLRHDVSDAVLDTLRTELGLTPVASGSPPQNRS